MGGHYRQACMEDDSLDLVAICDVNVAAAAAVDPSVPSFADYATLLAAHVADAVIINTPHHLHDSMAIDAMEAGYHVLVEKPMAVTTQRCDNMIATMRRTGRHLSVGHVQAHLNDKVTAKAYLDSGRLGNLLAIVDARTTRYGGDSRSAWFNDPAKAGGGALFNIGSHCIDRTTWIAGERVVKVSAWVTRRFGLDVETDGVITLELTNGIPVTISVISNPPEHTETLTLIGSAGTLSAGPFIGVRLTTTDGTTQLEPPHPNPIQSATASQLHQFVTDIHTPNAASNAEHARHVIEVLEASYLSARSGKAISLPLPV